MDIRTANIVLLPRLAQVGFNHSRNSNTVYQNYYTANTVDTVVFTKCTISRYPLVKKRDLPQLYSRHKTWETTISGRIHQMVERYVDLLYAYIAIILYILTYIYCLRDSLRFTVGRITYFDFHNAMGDITEQNDRQTESCVSRENIRSESL